MAAASKLIVAPLYKGVGANVLRSRVDNQPLRSRETGQYLIARSA